MTLPTDYYIIRRDYRHLGWGYVGEDTVTMADAVDALIEGFKDGGAANLDTVQIWRFASDMAPRDVTEDVLLLIGAQLSAAYSAEDYPAAFLEWASLVIQESVEELANADWVLEQRIVGSRECVG